MAQALGLRPDIRQVDRKKRLVAESTVEALRTWNDAAELEKCPREENWTELYPILGNADALQEIWRKNKNRTHCSFLRKDSNACECLPSDADGVPSEYIGKPCPHNAYAQHSQVFANRDGVSDAIERIMRLVNSAEIGVLDTNLDPLTVTELITARVELDRIQSEKQKREYERSRVEAQANQVRRE